MKEDKENTRPEREEGGDKVRGWRKDGEAKGKERDHDKGEALLATLALASAANSSARNSSRLEVVVFNQSRDEVQSLNGTSFHTVHTSSYSISNFLHIFNIPYTYLFIVPLESYLFLLMPVLTLC